MTDMSLLFIAFILGIVEGLTEFLPVSSTGHMIIVGSILGFTGKKAEAFEVIIQLGAIMAVVVVFWRRLLMLAGTFVSPLAHKNKTPARQLTWLHVLLAMAPAVILGLLLHDVIKTLFNLQSVAYALVAGAILLLIAEWSKAKNPQTTLLDNMTYRQAFVIGCFQCLALWPGFSRSGATISGAMLMGMSRYTASEFSFILAVPVMLGASGLSLYRNLDILTADDLPMFITGFITAFIVALMTVNAFLALTRRISFIPFVIWRFAVAAGIYLVFM